MRPSAIKIWFNPRNNSASDRAGPHPDHFTLSLARVIAGSWRVLQGPGGSWRVRRPTLPLPGGIRTRTWLRGGGGGAGEGEGAGRGWDARRTTSHDLTCQGGGVQAEGPAEPCRVELFNDDLLPRCSRVGKPAA